MILHIVEKNWRQTKLYKWICAWRSLFWTYNLFCTEFLLYDNKCFVKNSIWWEISIDKKNDCKLIKYCII